MFIRSNGIIMARRPASITEARRWFMETSTKVTDKWEIFSDEEKMLTSIEWEAQFTHVKPNLNAISSSF